MRPLLLCRTPLSIRRLILLLLVDVVEWLTLTLPRLLFDCVDPAVVLDGVYELEEETLPWVCWLRLPRCELMVAAFCVRLGALVLVTDDLILLLVREDEKLSEWLPREETPLPPRYADAPSRVLLGRLLPLLTRLPPELMLRLLL